MGRIIIKNCKCIKEAKIEIADDALNIKYAPNGTGKTTISQAIQQKINDDKLKNYMTPLDDISLEPSVESDYASIKVFNEDYVNQFIFTNKATFADSFSVFIKDDSINKISDEIEEKNKELRDFIKKNENIDKLVDCINELTSIIKTKNGKVQKQGGLGELIRGYGAGFDKRIKLNIFSDYYNNPDFRLVSSWAKWRNDYEGPNIYEIKKCPYCANELNDNQEDIDSEFNVVFKNSSLSSANKLDTALKKMDDNKLINTPEKEKILQLLGDANKSAELQKRLDEIAAEMNYINSKISLFNILINSKVYNIEQIKDFKDLVAKLSIDRDSLKTYFNTEIINSLIANINQMVGLLEKKAKEIEGLINRQNIIISKIISSNEDDIRDFFKIAGFPYDFKIECDENGNYQTYLFLKDNKVKEPSNYLSWGERNAFAVVMFMFEAILEEPELIVLDDPISSIDNYKKFAVMRRLFRNQTGFKSFHGKTVLLLTHEKQVLIDYVYNRSLSRYIEMKCNAHYLYNSNGTIEEKTILRNDFVNAYKFNKDEAEKDDWPIKLVCSRKVIEYINPDYMNDLEYQGISNLIHGRDTLKDNNETEFDSEKIKLIKDAIKMKYSKKYEDILLELSADKLQKKIMLHSKDSKNNYCIAIYSRLLFMRKPELLNELEKTLPGIRKFVNETNHIEDDFIFQLDPNKFPEMPNYYIEKIVDFVSNDK